MNTNIVMKKGSTLFLRATLIVMAVIVLALCIFVVPAISKDVSEFLQIGPIQYPIMLGVYATAVLFFIALYQSFMLLQYIDTTKAFSELSVVALKRIKYCALAIMVLFGAGMPVLFLIADKDDAPGLIIFGMIITCAPLVVATFAAVLQKLLKNAIEIKAENDLIV